MKDESCHQFSFLSYCQSNDRKNKEECQLKEMLRVENESYN